MPKFMAHTISIVNDTSRSVIDASRSIIDDSGVLLLIEVSFTIDLYDRTMFSLGPYGLYYKHMTIINDDSSIINKLGASLTDHARVIFYDRHMFIV
jgi:hypothetical protein